MSPDHADAAGTRVVVLAALVAFGLHVATLGRYGYFADEFYYLEAARHLDWGYVEFPPASVGFLALWTRVFGETVEAIRVPPALLHAVLVVLTGRLARALGGNAWAQALAAIAVATCPLYLVFHHFHSPHAIDYAVWSGVALVLASILRRPRRRSWLLLGVLLGFGALNRESTVWLGVGIAAGLLLTRHRHLLLTDGPWLAAGIAIGLALPYVFWQAQHGWPLAEFVRALRQRTVGPVSLPELVAPQVTVMSPVLFPLWAGGLCWLLLAPAGRPFAPFAVVYLVTMGILAASGTSKAYYPAPAYPPLLAAGGVVVERMAGRLGWTYLPAATAAVLVLAAVVSLPLALPVLPVESLVAYQRLLGVEPPLTIRRARGALPGHFAGMQEWPEIVASVAAVHDALPADERTRATLFAGDWTTAAALNVLGGRRGLPRTVSGHNAYAFWGGEDADGRTLVAVAVLPEHLSAWYADVRIAGTVACRYCLPARVGQPIYVARGPRASFATFFAAMRHFD